MIPVSYTSFKTYVRTWSNACRQATALFARSKGRKGKNEDENGVGGKKEDDDGGGDGGGD